MSEEQILKIYYPLKYAQISLAFLAIDEIRFKRFSGSAIRGIFGWALRKTTCVTGLKDCTTCPIYGNCVYAYVFDTPTINRNGILQKTPFAPHPFVIEPPTYPLTVKSGQKFEFLLTLFGRALDFLPYFLKSFEILGSIRIANGRAHLLYAYQEERVIYAGGKIVSSPKVKEIIYSKPGFQPRNDEITVNFLTPTKMIQKGKLETGPEFSTLIKSIARRLNWLVQFHSNDHENKVIFNLNPTEIDKVYVTIKNEKIRRYSNRKNQFMQFKSFTGKIVYKGKNIWEYYPILKAGEIIHVGKATSFGFGKIKIS